VPAEVIDDLFLKYPNFVLFFGIIFFPKSGEEGFRSMSKYHGYAKDPMIERIDKVRPNIPIWFIYGSRTWIDYTSAYSCIWLRHRVHSKTAHISVEVIGTMILYPTWNYY
jgi:hypothetical protein